MIRSPYVDELMSEWRYYRDLLLKADFHYTEREIKMHHEPGKGTDPNQVKKALDYSKECNGASKEYQETVQESSDKANERMRASFERYNLEAPQREMTPQEKRDVFNPDFHCAGQNCSYCAWYDACSEYEEPDEYNDDFDNSDWEDYDDEDWDETASCLKQEKHKAQTTKLAEIAYEKFIKTFGIVSIKKLVFNYSNQEYLCGWVLANCPTNEKRPTEEVTEKDIVITLSTLLKLLDNYRPDNIIRELELDKIKRDNLEAVRSWNEATTKYFTTLLEHTIEPRLLTPEDLKTIRSYFKYLQDSPITKEEIWETVRWIREHYE